VCPAGSVVGLSHASLLPCQSCACEAHILHVQTHSSCSAQLNNVPH